MSTEIIDKYIDKLKNNINDFSKIKKDFKKELRNHDDSGIFDLVERNKMLIIEEEEVLKKLVDSIDKQEENNPEVSKIFLNPLYDRYKIYFPDKECTDNKLLSLFNKNNKVFIKYVRERYNSNCKRNINNSNNERNILNYRTSVNIALKEGNINKINKAISYIHNNLFCEETMDRFLKKNSQNKNCSYINIYKDFMLDLTLDILKYAIKTSNNNLIEQQRNLIKEIYCNILKKCKQHKIDSYIENSNNLLAHHNELFRQMTFVLESDELDVSLLEDELDTSKCLTEDIKFNNDILGQTLNQESLSDKIGEEIHDRTLGKRKSYLEYLEEESFHKRNRAGSGSFLHTYLDNKIYSFNKENSL